MVEIKSRHSSEFDRQRLSTVALVIFNGNNEVFTKERKKPDKGRNLAVISGGGPFAQHPDDPDEVARIELKHSVGVELILTRMYVADGGVGVYVGFVEGDGRELLTSGGSSQGRSWVPVEQAVRLNMAFDQQAYIKKVAEDIVK